MDELTFTVLARLFRELADKLDGTLQEPAEIVSEPQATSGGPVPAAPSSVASPEAMAEKANDSTPRDTRSLLKVAPKPLVELYDVITEWGLSRRPIERYDIARVLFDEGWTPSHLNTAKMMIEEAPGVPEGQVTATLRKVLKDNERRAGALYKVEKEVGDRE